MSINMKSQPIYTLQTEIALLELFNTPKDDRWALLFGYKYQVIKNEEKLFYFQTKDEAMDFIIMHE